ncbi:hypothetical protein JAO85_20450 [Comamonas sp. NyZ500]|uniref:hypothetical protein n=1 Tax=Comamonas sp. NyZ500 TaxID=2795732 RepID=UPI00192BDE1B|nr:hypothetical protein [Comamonas sp. NyZ500]MBL5979652.1 hypothetical protein [Comamonas sp. NyZ500]
MNRSFALLLGMTVCSFSYANTDCPTSWTSDLREYPSGRNLGSDTIVFTPLKNKILTRQELDEIYQLIKTNLEAAQNSPSFLPNTFLSKKDDGRRFSETYASGRIPEGNLLNMFIGPSSTPYSMRGYKTAPETEQVAIQLSQARVNAYACHQAKGWPSATDYVAVAAKANGKTGDEKAQNRSRQEAKRLDEKQEANFQTLIQSTETAEQNEVNRGGAQRNKVDLPQRHQCLRVVDVKQDKTVPSMYWYAIQNSCKEPLQAYWCAGEKSECKQPKQSWLIKPGAKERSWMDSPNGSQGVQFYGTACVTKFEGRQVYYDKNRAQCWAWDAN